MKKALKPHGKAVVVDLKEHQFTEFRKEMGDIHLGSNLEHIEKNAKKFFKKASIEKLPGISCSSSGRSATLRGLRDSIKLAITYTCSFSSRCKKLYLIG